jgi:hypothetical protein
MLALAAHEASLCPCCGYPRAVAHDPTRPWLVDKTICQAGRARDRVQRDWQKRYGKDPEAGDGLLWWVEPYEG